MINIEMPPKTIEQIEHQEYIDKVKREIQAVIINPYYMISGEYPKDEE